MRFIALPGLNPLNPGGGIGLEESGGMFICHWMASIGIVAVIICKMAQQKQNGWVIFITVKSPVFAVMGMYKKKSKKRQKQKKRGGKSHCTTSLYQEKKANEAWLLVSNLPTSKAMPKQIVKTYSTRMQIEESFRDSKNSYYGLGLSQAKSRSEARYDNLLLIAALVQFLLWCIGKVACQQGYQKMLQANTIVNRTVLSFIYIAKQVINDKRYKIYMKDLKKAFTQLNQDVM